MREATALNPYIVRIVWENESVSEIDLHEWLNKSKWFSPVLESDAVWNSLHVDEFGWNIVWNGCEMEIPSATMWRLYQEQTCQAMSRSDFISWLERHDLSLVKASTTLGLSRRMVTYYKSGERIIPRTVLLACKAVDAEPGLRQ